MPEPTAAGRAKRQELLQKARARAQRTGEAPVTRRGPEYAELDSARDEGSQGSGERSRGGGATDELRHRVAKLEGQLSEARADATRWRRALQTQREEHRSTLEQLHGLQQANGALRSELVEQRDRASNEADVAARLRLDLTEAQRGMDRLRREQKQLLLDAKKSAERIQVSERRAEAAERAAAVDRQAARDKAAQVADLEAATRQDADVASLDTADLHRQVREGTERCAAAEAATRKAEHMLMLKEREMVAKERECERLRTEATANGIEQRLLQQRLAALEADLAELQNDKNDEDKPAATASGTRYLAQLERELRQSQLELAASNTDAQDLRQQLEKARGLTGQTLDTQIDTANTARAGSSSFSPAQGSGGATGDSDTGALVVEIATLEAQVARLEVPGLAGLLSQAWMTAATIVGSRTGCSDDKEGINDSRCTALADVVGRVDECITNALSNSETPMQWLYGSLDNKSAATRPSSEGDHMAGILAVLRAATRQLQDGVATLVAPGGNGMQLGPQIDLVGAVLHPSCSLQVENFMRSGGSQLATSLNMLGTEIETALASLASSITRLRQAEGHAGSWHAQLAEAQDLQRQTSDDLEVCRREVLGATQAYQSEAEAHRATKEELRLTQGRADKLDSVRDTRDRLANQLDTLLQRVHRVFLSCCPAGVAHSPPSSASKDPSQMQEPKGDGTWQLEAISNRVAELEQSTMNSETEAAELAAANQRQQGELLKLTNLLRSVDTELKGVSGELHGAAGDKASLAKKLDASEALAAELQQNVAAAEAQTALAQAAAAAEAEACKTATDRSKEVTYMLAWLERRHDEVSHQYTVVRENHEATQAEVRILKHELGRTRAELTQLRATLGKMQRKVDATKQAQTTATKPAPAPAQLSSSVQKPGAGRRARSARRVNRG